MPENLEISDLSAKTEDELIELYEATLARAFLLDVKGADTTEVDCQLVELGRALGFGLIGASLDQVENRSKRSWCDVEPEVDSPDYVPEAAEKLKSRKFLRRSRHK